MAACQLRDWRYIKPAHHDLGNQFLQSHQRLGYAVVGIAQLALGGGFLFTLPLWTQKPSGAAGD